MESEILFIMLLALIVLGPRRLPEIGRQIGKALAELRRAKYEFTRQIEEEIRNIEEEEAVAKARTALATARDGAAILRGDVAAVGERILERFTARGQEKIQADAVDSVAADAPSKQAEGGASQAGAGEGARAAQPANAGEAARATQQAENKILPPRPAGTIAVAGVADREPANTSAAVAAEGNGVIIAENHG